MRRWFVVGVVLASLLVCGSAQAARDPRLPAPPLPSELLGPYPLEVVDERMGSTKPIPERRLGDWVVRGENGSVTPWVIESTVAEWVTAVLVRGAAASGFLLDPNADAPDERLRFVIGQFLCEAAPLTPSRCRVDLRLEWVGAGATELVWEYQEVVQYFDGFSFANEREVPGQIAGRIVDSLELELEDALAPPAPQWSGDAVDLEIGTILVAGEPVAFTVLAESEDALCLDTDPPRWLSGVATKRVRIPGASAGTRWVGALVDGVMRYGRPLHPPLSRPAVAVMGGVVLGTSVPHAEEGRVPGPKRADRCPQSAVASSVVDTEDVGAADVAAVPDGPSRNPYGLAKVWLVDRRYRRLDIDSVRLDRRLRRLPKVYAVSADDPKVRLSWDELNARLNDPRLDEHYDRIHTARATDRVQDGIAALIAGSLLTTGVLMANIGAATGEAGLAVPGAIQVALGGAGLGIAIPNFAKSSRDWARLEDGRLDEVEAPRLVLEAIEAYNASE